MAITPFKFLDSYTREDQDIFFGREKEVEELYYKILDGNLLIVYGSSGTGKTSLIQCGLSGKFQDADWMPVLIRRGADINLSIKKTLQQAAITPLKEKNTISEDIRSVYLDHFKPVYLLFDQFEELFIFGDDNEIAKFTDNLKSAMEAGLTCKFIFVIRGEYLENISVFEDKIPDFFNNRIRIERMTRKNAMRVITEPCKLFNVGVSEDFPAKMLEKLGNEKGATIELTYLQVYLDKLYKSASSINSKNPVFDEALLLEFGEIEDVLSEFLDEQIAKTKKPEDALSILKSFVSDEGTKKQMSIAEVFDFTRALGKEFTTELTEDYVHQLVDLRILKDKDDNGKYELRHDALAAKIYKQISFGEKELLEIRQFIINRFNDFKKRNALLEKADIDYILPYENKIFLNPEQREFVYNSVRESKRKRNNRRNIFISIGALLVLTLSGLSIFAFWQRNQALVDKQTALQKTKEALNEKELADKAKDMSLKASKEAMSAAQYAELQSNIANEQKKMAEEQELKAKQQTELANTEKQNALSQTELANEQKQKAQQQTELADEEKHKAEAAQFEADRLRLVSLSQNVAFKSLQIKNDPQLAALLSNEAYTLAKDNKGSVQDPQIYNALYQSLKNFSLANYPAITKVSAEVKAMNIATDNKPFAILADGSLARYNSTTNDPASRVALGGAMINTAYLGNDNKYAVTTYDNYTVRIWNTATGTGSEPLPGHTGLVRAAAFSNDGNLVATGGRDSSVIIWNNNKLQQQIKFPSRVRALAMNDNNILAGCEDGIVYEYNTGDNKMSTLVNNKPARIQCITYSSHKKFLIVSSSDGRLSILTESGQLIKTFAEGHSVDFVSADDESGLLAEATVNNLIRIYNLNDLSQRPLEINEITDAIKGLAIANDGNLLVACGNNAILGYSVRSAVIQSLLAGKITRSLTQEEWNTYIGIKK